MCYQCELTSVEGFIQYLASNVLSSGYFFYVQGWVPEGKDPRAVDRKLLGKYGIDLSRSSRARRKRAGLANLHYLRHGQAFLLLATHGRHPFFVEEGEHVSSPLKKGLTAAVL